MKVAESIWALHAHQRSYHNEFCLCPWYCQHVPLGICSCPKLVFIHLTNIDARVCFNSFKHGVSFPGPLKINDIVSNIDLSGAKSMATFFLPYISSTRFIIHSYSL